METETVTLKNLTKHAIFVLVVALSVFVVGCQKVTSTPTATPPAALTATTTAIAAPTPTPTPTPTPAPAVAAACQPSPPPTAVSPARPDGLYQGALFDAHLHLIPPIIDRFGSADALCRYLDKGQTLWAVGFYSLSPEPQLELAKAMPIIRAARSRIVPLVLPASRGPFAGAFAQGKFTEEVLRSYLQPQGPLQGVGELALYRDDLQSVTFESPAMQTVLRVVNERKGIVMVHPSGSPRGRQMDLAEIEPAVRSYPNIIFLFHGGIPALDLVLPLMSQYPNVYFSWDGVIFLGPWGYLLTPEGHGSGPGSAERFVADVNRIGADRIAEESLKNLLPRLQQHPDRIMWGTDRGTPWHFDESATDLIIRVSRQLIARLPAELQERYAFRNALQVFGGYLSPGP